MSVIIHMACVARHITRAGHEQLAFLVSSGGELVN
jgi:hypothetical protein